LRGTFQHRGALVADATGRLTLPFAPELRPRAPPAPGEPSELGGPALLAAVAARTGGRVLTNPADLFDPGHAELETRQPVRTQVLLATLFLCVADVLMRRVRLRRLTRNV
jgi:hypothetical protein